MYNRCIGITMLSCVVILMLHFQMKPRHTCFSVPFSSSSMTLALVITNVGGRFW